MAGLIDENVKNAQGGDWKDKDISHTLSHTQRVAAADPQFVKYPAGQYDVSNPHPGFGVDPNILNEYGHTKYPMWVGDKIANNAEEEAALRNPPPAPELRQDGPTIEQYVNAGYKASTYPPNGYAAKSSPEEVQQWIDKEKSTPDPWT